MPRVRLILLIVVLIAVIAGVYFWITREPQSTGAVNTSVPVEVARVERRDVPMLIRSLGFVRALRSIDIRPQVGGMLVELPATEGKVVKRGDLLARIDDRAILASLRQAEAERNVTRAELNIARLDLKRYENLVRDRAAPAQTLDQQKALVARLEATLATRDATVAAAQVQMTYTRIVSPTDGRVGIRNAYEGSVVSTNDTTGLFSVVQTQPISVEASLPQSRLPELQRMLARPEGARVQAFAQDGGQPIAEGRLTLIDNRVAVDSGTIRVRAHFDNDDERLWPDQSVLVTLEAEVLEGALVVPSRALRQGSDGPFVWLVTDGKAVTKAVHVRHQTDAIAVIDNVEVGDEVVVDGQARLRPGVAVSRVGDKSVAEPGA
jgi:membrane fusion protein, multidrug efflux system